MNPNAGLFVLAEAGIGKAWVAYLRHILSAGVIVPDDREDILEAPPVCLEVRYDQGADPILERYADAKIVSLYTRKMFSREVIPELNSTYGDRLFNYHGVDQIAWIVDRLNSKWWSKSSVISLLKPNEDMPRIPCLISIMAIKRNDEIILNAIFRSQNAFNSYGNFLGLKEIHQLIADGTNSKVGILRSIALAPHIYRSDVRQAAKNVEDLIQCPGISLERLASWLDECTENSRHVSPTCQIYPSVR